MSEIPPDSEEQGTEGRTGESNLNQKINTLRETVLQLLVEVESLAVTARTGLRPNTRLDEEVRQFEMNLIRSALGRTGGSQTRAAKLLGLKLSTLNAKIKRYQMIPICYLGRVTRSEMKDNVA
jgi:transcriptional regulator with PAS, ATPase and Fis domain